MRFSRWFIACAVLVLVVNAAIWLPAYLDCKARRGVLLRDAFGMPACMAPGIPVGSIPQAPR